MCYGLLNNIDNPINLTYNIKMDLPIDDKELEVIVRQLWKSRKNGGEPLVEPLYEKMKLIKEVRDENPDGPYKKILRERGMVI
tara:strand:+ start:1760 stop:2008 length:249 start_codon:yes stop_codon:yes gene_type:complete